MNEFRLSGKVVGGVTKRDKSLRAGIHVDRMELRGTGDDDMMCTATSEALN